MILQFRNNLDEVITTISTKESTIDLNMYIDFEAASAGNGNILHNNTIIGTFVRTAGSPVTITFLSGNYTREVQNGDEFKLMSLSPLVHTVTLNVVRVSITEVPKVSKVIKEVTRFLPNIDFPVKIKNSTQKNILIEYNRNITPKHLSKFVKELLYPVRNIPHPDITTFLNPDAFYCSNGVPLIITVSDILNNDKVRVSGNVVDNSTVDLLEIVGVKNPIGGTITTTIFNSRISSIRFTNTAPIGSTGTFVCEIKNKSTNEIFESIVTIYIKPPHPINAINDVFNLIQWNTLNLTKQQLIANDSTSNPPITFVEIISNTINRGTVNISGDNISFISTGFVGQPAGFQYRIRDSKNNTSIGNVNINILELPPIEAYLFSTTDLNNFMASYVPPTLVEIFNTWARFSNNGLYFPPGTTPTGEAASWERSGSGFRCTVNSVDLTGFVSPKAYDNYTHEATLSSTANDDDTIALIVAFKRDGTTNRALLAVREPGGMGGYTQNTSWSLVTNTNGVNSVITRLASFSIVRKTANWPSAGATSVKVERIGSMIIAYCSQFGTTNLLTTSKLEIDLNNYPELAWALEPMPYGYACHSQQYSTYSNVVFEGGINANEIFDFALNCTWEYISGSWVKNTSKTIQSVLGYPRTITNPDNGYVYRIEQNSIARIE